MAEISNYTHPEVIFDVIFDKGVFVFSIKNITHLPAFSVRVNFDKKIMGVQGKVEISKLKIFQQLDYLAPHKEIKVFLDSASAYFQRKGPTKFIALIKWLDSEKKAFHRKIPHNLNAYKDLGFIEFNN